MRAGVVMAGLALAAGVAGWWLGSNFVIPGKERVEDAARALVPASARIDKAGQYCTRLITLSQCTFEAYAEYTGGASDRAALLQAVSAALNSQGWSITDDDGNRLLIRRGPLDGVMFVNGPPTDESVRGSIEIGYADGVDVWPLFTGIGGACAAVVAAVRLMRRREWRMHQRLPAAGFSSPQL